MSALASTLPYTTGTVTSKDGTTIGYRQMGQGEALILVHGGMQASQHFTQLASALADAFTVYIPDRRGRGMSGAYGNNYSIQRDVEDLSVLLDKTEAHNIFALSSGAVISLTAALTLPTIHKLALYEPPFSTNPSTYPYWLTRFDHEIAQGKLAAAMVTGFKGIHDTSIFGRLPRFLSVPILNLGINDQASEAAGDDVPVTALVPTLHYDAEIVIETAGDLARFKAISAEVLLLGGSKSAAYLKAVLDGLNTVLPHVRRIEFAGFDHIAASNDEHPQEVAKELRKFFRQVQ